MKIHPLPRPNNITLRYDVASVLSRKKLRRVPHVFEKVLELPFCSSAHVSVDETPDSLKFTAATDDMTGGVRADAVEVCPGVIKVVVRGNGVAYGSGAELELDLWRFRLPDTMRCELASAAYVDGELVVTVPKGEVGGDTLLLSDYLLG